MFQKTLKYKLYPSKAQRRRMKEALEACRWVYNKALEARKIAWEEHQESLSNYDTNRMIPGWRKEHPSIDAAYSQSLQDACWRVDLAFQSFFRRCENGKSPGYPRFKGKGWYKSFTYPQNGFRIDSSSKTIYLSKIGNVKLRPKVSIEEDIKRIIIKRDALGNWYACFVVEFEPEPLEPTHKVVGVDLGCEKFATFSDGEQVDNPRFFRKDENALARAQRRLDECKKGTSEYHKRKRVVQHIHHRIKNRRHNFAHQLSRKLVDNYQIIVFEDLDIQDMQDGNWRSLNKSISDAAWGQLVRMTSYKAEWAGRTVVTVDPRNTSQMCSGCGEIVKKPLSERVHKCPHCSLELDRDINAAKNILARGMASLGKIPKNP